MAIELELPDLGMYYGTENYYSLAPLIKTVVTDGVKYIMDNGYSWFVTDTLIALEQKGICRREPFMAIKLEVNKEEESAEVKVTDGNNKLLYGKVYDYTDAKVTLNLFLSDGILMLSGEY